MATGRDLRVSSAWFDAPATGLAVRLDGPDLGIDDIFVETEVNGLSFARPEPVGDGIYQIGISGAVDNLDLVGQTVRLTVRKGSQFSEQAIIISSASAHVSERPDLTLMIIFALLGGLILNIMPCAACFVFEVDLNPVNGDQPSPADQAEAADRGRRYSDQLFCADSRPCAAEAGRGADRLGNSVPGICIS